MSRLRITLKKVLLASVALNLLLVLIVFYVFDSETSNYADYAQPINQESVFAQYEASYQANEMLVLDLVGQDLQELTRANYDMVDVHVSELYFSPYRLYYGEWIVSEWSGANSRFGPSSEENINRMIGTTIIMKPNFFSFGDEFINDNPRYRIAIIPQNPAPYLTFFPSAACLGIKTPFFVFVHVDFVSMENKLERSPNSIVGFFIKDDDTLYLVDITDVYRLDRVNHMEGNPLLFNIAP